jgi:hypothetical protein
MRRDLGANPQACAINTATLGFQAPIEDVIDAVAPAGLGGIAKYAIIWQSLNGRRSNRCCRTNRACREWMTGGF